MSRSILARRSVAIALVSAAVILLQVSVTRLLSVLVWYHWAFFSISLAMLGLGAPGVWFSISQPKATTLERLLLSASIIVPTAVVLLVKVSHWFGEHAILFCMFALLPAVLTLGASVVLLLLEARGPRVGRMYAFDLFGACLAALSIVPLLWRIPTPELAGAIGLLPLVAYVVIGGRPAVVLLVGAALGGALLQGELFAVRHSKTYAEVGPRTPIYERWTPTARLTVFDSIFFRDRQDGGFGWGYGTVTPEGVPPEEYWLEQDGNAGTPITRLSTALSNHRYLFHDVTTVGYQLRPPERAAIVGSGGGRDIITAKLAGAKHIDAIELNAGIVEALRNRFADFSGGVYDLEGVSAIVGEGRSVLTRSRGGYDLIQISLIDSWAATAAGAYSLSENSLYTVEAYRLYWSRLSETGMVSTSRWALTSFSLELPRLLFLVEAALRAEEVAAPKDHIAVFQGGPIGTVLLSKTPFSADEIDSMRRIASARGFQIHLPVTNFQPGEDWMSTVLDRGPDAFAEKNIRMEPPTDDRPFFFQVLSPFDRVDPLVVAQAGLNGQAVSTLQSLMIVMVLITALTFYAPRPLRFLRGADFWRGSFYFASIGFAFMLVETAWLGRFILYLGHPSLAMTACLSCLLLGAGIGSMSSARTGVATVAQNGFLAPALLASLNAAFAPLFAATLGYAFALRITITIATLVPAGFVMGFFFPLGMLRFGDTNKAWFWALNGAASVLASVGSLALAMEFGFTSVANAGAAFYAVAWLLLRESRSSRARAVTESPRLERRHVAGSEADAAL